MTIPAFDLPTIFSLILAVGVFMYVLMDGFDLGVGILFLFNPNKHERDDMMNSVAPVWDGNETWMILGGVIIWAAFPGAYSTLLPALYLPIFFMLFGLIFRGIAFEFRFKSEKSQYLWDFSFAFGSTIATFFQGVVLGTFIRGIPVDPVTMQYAGGPFDWLHWFGIMVGIALVCGYGLLGATWLVLKTEGELQKWAKYQAQIMLLFVCIFVFIVSLWTPFDNHHIFERWFVLPNFFYLAPIPFLTFLCVWNLFHSLKKEGEDLKPFLYSIALFGFSFLGLGISLWPYAVPKELTIWDVSSPYESQKFTLYGVVALLPVVLGYTIYSYRIFRGKVKDLKTYH